MDVVGVGPLGLAPPAEGLSPPQPQAAAGRGTFAEAIASALGPGDAGDEAAETAEQPPDQPSSEVDVLALLLALAGGVQAPTQQPVTVEVDRPDRTAEVGIEGIDVTAAWQQPIAGTAELSTSGGERVNPAVTLLPQATADLGAASSGAVAPDVVIEASERPIGAEPGAAVAVEADGLGRPEERLGEQLRDIAPRERQEVAQTGNRAGEPPQIETDEPTSQVEASADARRAAAQPVIRDASTRAEAAGEAGTLEALMRIVEAEAGGDAAGGDLDDASAGTDAEASGESQPFAGQTAVSTAASRLEANGAARTERLETLDVTRPGQFASSVAESVRHATRTGADSIRLVLNPPELGHLDVRVTEGERGMTVTLLAASGEVGDLIQQQLPLLRSALEARDLRVDRLEVQQSEASSLGLGHPGEQAGGRQDGGREAAERPEWSSVASMERTERRSDLETAVASEVAGRTRDPRPGGGRLDLVA